MLMRRNGSETVVIEQLAHCFLVVYDNLIFTLLCVSYEFGDFVLKHGKNVILRKIVCIRAYMECYAQLATTNAKSIQIINFAPNTSTKKSL